MSNLLTTDPLALGLLLTDELYLVGDAPAPAFPVAVTMPDKPAVIDFPAAVTTGFDYLGDNNRFFLILLISPGEKYAPAWVIESLGKILKGLKLDMADVALVNLSRFPGTQFTQLREFFACSKVVLFGIDPKSLGLPDLPSNEPGKIDGVKMMSTFSFEEMNLNDQKKRMFWNEMKNF